MPLDEDLEAYELDILRDGVVVRTLKASEPLFQYSLDSELLDFGQKQTSLSIIAYQMSSLLGRGLPAKEQVFIK
jgi:hypothetical protein